MAITLVQTVTVGSGGASSISFTNIPQTGKDLLLFYSLRGSDSGGNSGLLIFKINDLNIGGLQATVNAAALTLSANYTQNPYYGFQQLNTAGTTANQFNTGRVHYVNYATNTIKLANYETATTNNSSTSYSEFANLTSNATTAISSVQVLPWQGTFVQYSTASLYIIS